MRTTGRLGIPVLALLGVVSMAVAAPGKGSPETGKKLYLESCRHCHGARGDGKGEMGAYLTPPPSDLTSGKTQAKSDAELRKVIMEGRAGTAMTGFGTYNDEQVAALLAYIRSLKP